MSATNHTSNYNLPIYEAGNTANWLVDFNGAMSTIDQSMNENKLAGDTLKTNMEELQTDFQQVSTKADAAEQAATQASQNAANALTIANNATTIAGDAQVDAHAALTQIEKIITLPKNSYKADNQINSNITYNLNTLSLTILFRSSAKNTPDYWRNFGNSEIDKHIHTYSAFTPSDINPAWNDESFPINSVMGIGTSLANYINDESKVTFSTQCTLIVSKIAHLTFLAGIRMSESAWNYGINNVNEHLYIAMTIPVLFRPVLPPLQLSVCNTKKVEEFELFRPYLYSPLT